MSTQLEKKKVAILATDGFEEVELVEPRKALQNAGATTHIVAPAAETIQAWDHTDWSDKYEVDVKLEEANPEDYDALFLPGGVLNPDKLRMNQQAVKFTKHFLQAGKPVAAICHGPQLLIETHMLDGRTMTSYRSIKSDMINAGANWIDEEVVVDRGIITSRNPDDIPVFSETIIEEFSKGVKREMAHSQ